MGILYYNDRRFLQAEVSFRKVIALSSDNTELSDSSKTYINKILKENTAQKIGKKNTIEDTTKSLYERAYKYYVDSNFEYAEKLFLEALDKEPESCKIVEGLGSVYLKKKQPEKAEKYLNICANKEPYNEKLYLLLGICYEMQNKIKEAEKTYLLFYSRNPNDKDILLRLIIVCEKQNKLDIVKRYKKKLKKL